MSELERGREYERNHAQRYTDAIAPPVTEPPPSQAADGEEPHPWVVRRSLSEIINGRLRRRSDASFAKPLARATA